MIRHWSAGTGPDVVLLHGVGLDHTMWNRCLPGLAGGHRVTTVDLRGHGASGPAAPGTGLADLAADVVAVTDAIGAGRVHLVGFSLGALIAAHVAAKQPDRIATLSLVSSVAPRTPAEAEAVHRRLRSAGADFAATVDAAVARWFDDDFAGSEPDLVAAVRRTMLANDRASYLACYSVFATGDQEAGPLLGAITAPTLAITGGADPGSTPEMAYRLAAAVPGARAEIVAGARHLLPLQRPGTLVAALTQHFARGT